MRPLHCFSLSVGAVLLAAGGCALQETGAPSVSPALSRSGVAAGTLAEGRDIFTRTCTACHAAHPVSSHSLVEWQGIVDKMAPRARLDAARKSALLAYLAALKAAPPAG